MRLLDVRMEVLGSPGLPGNSNPAHGTFQAESGSAVFRVSFPLGVSPWFPESMAGFQWLQLPFGLSTVKIPTGMGESSSGSEV